MAQKYLLKWDAYPCFQPEKIIFLLFWSASSQNKYYKQLPKQENHIPNFSNQLLDQKSWNSWTIKGSMESIDEPCGLNWTGLVFPMSDPIQMLNIGHISIDINIYGLMGIPSTPSRYVWWLDADDVRPKYSLSDDLLPALAASGAPLPTTMLQETSEL